MVEFNPPLPSTALARHLRVTHAAWRFPSPEQAGQLSLTSCPKCHCYLAALAASIGKHIGRCGRLESASILKQPDDMMDVGPERRGKRPRPTSLQGLSSN